MWHWAKEDIPPNPQRENTHEKYTTSIWLHLDEVWEQMNTNLLDKKSEQWPPVDRVTLCQLILSCAHLWLHITSGQQIQRGKAARTQRCERKPGSRCTETVQHRLFPVGRILITFHLTRPESQLLSLLYFGEAFLSHMRLRMYAIKYCFIWVIRTLERLSLPQDNPLRRLRI